MIRILTLCSMLAAAAGAGAAERLNIVFCFADDWGRYAGCYAGLDGRPTLSDVVKTPNIDRVARQGVVFRNAFVNAPSCTPCRSAMMSGRYFFNTGLGAILHNAVWDTAIPSYPLMLRDAGYHIGETWKAWSPGTPGDAPFGGGKYAYESAGRAFNLYSQNVTQMVVAGTPLDQARQKLLAEVDGNFQAFLDARPVGKPFLYYIGPTNVHRKWQKGSGKALWGIEPDSLKGKLPAFLPDVPEIREDLADYLGEAQAFDALVGRVVDKLQAIGELDKTVIVISGDHGAPGFPRGKCNLYDFGVGVALVARWPGAKGGRVVDDFVNLMDLAPTFMQIGGVAPPPGVNGRSLVPLLDSDRAGRIDPQRSFTVTGRERHVSHARAGNLPYPQRALRTDDFLYIRNFRPERWPMGDPYDLTDAAAPGLELMTQETYATFRDMDAGPTKAWLVAHRNDPKIKPYYDLAFAPRPAQELYDLRKDPDQVRNVAADPAYAADMSRLDALLMRTLTEAGDPRVVGDGMTFERMPYIDVQKDPQLPPKPKAKAKQQ
jgi:arylsulfatase A-like enzyme